MRKAIIAAIVATALFAVGAFAASFTVESEDVASGAAGVGACATNVEISYTTSTEVADSAVAVIDGDFVVTGATVRFTNVSGTGENTVIAAATGCEGATVDMALLTDADSTNRWHDADSCDDAVLAAGEVRSTCDFTDQPPVEGVVNARVLANGNAITDL